MQLNGIGLIHRNRLKHQSNFIICNRLYSKDIHCVKATLFPLLYVSFWLASSRLPFGFNKILTLQLTLTGEYQYLNSCIDQFLISVVYKDLHQYCHLATHCDYSCPFGQNCANQLSYGSNSELITLFSMHYSSFSWKLDYNFLQQAWLTDNFQAIEIWMPSDNLPCPLGSTKSYKQAVWCPL